jgi:hypothetical protein
MAIHAYSQVFVRSHSIVFFSDSMRTALRELIRENGLDPDKLMQEWATIERGVRAWLDSGHLNNIVVEFYRPWSSVASARWDFPVGYSGSGVDDDMWLDKSYLRKLIEKAARPTKDCTYRIVLCTGSGAPHVSGFTSCSFLSTGQLSARQAGTVIATGHMTAGVTYWR